MGKFRPSVTATVTSVTGLDSDVVQVAGYRLLYFGLPQCQYGIRDPALHSAVQHPLSVTLLLSRALGCFSHSHKRHFNSRFMCSVL